MDSNTIMVSISCTAYNQEMYIRDALDGFVNQKTDFPFEVLVHDDASTDATPEIIREYEKKYPDIIKPIYQKENQYSQHISIEKNYQIPRAKGKYAAICEGDDYWTDPYKLQKQVDFLESHPEYSLCGTACTWQDLRDNTEEPQFLIDADKDVSVEEIILEENGRIFPTVSVLMRKETYADMPDWKSKFPVGDFPFFVNAGLHGKIRMLADNTCVYRWHAVGSWTVSMNDSARKINFINRFNEGLEALDSATGFLYSQPISQRIHRGRFELAGLQKDWKTIRSKEYEKEWGKCSIKNKIALFLQCKIPIVYKILRCVLHGGK